MFKPLLRTIPTMCGNHMLACHVIDAKTRDDDSDIFDVYIDNASLVPLQNKLYDKIINCNLVSGKYEFEIIKYFKYYSNYFYNDNFSFDTNDYQQLNKLSRYAIERRNRDYEFGCKRLQTNDNKFQFVFYAPFYIDDVNDIPEYFKIHLKFNDTVEKDIIVHLNDSIKKKTYYNPLYSYLNRYISKIDNNVVYCLHETKQATYFGVDVKRGGFVQIKDNVIGSIYNNQQTMQNFDYTICDGFARNNLIMRQIIPIAFMFNIDDVLTQREKIYFTNYPVKITGNYYAHGRKIDFYDFSSNYVDYKLQMKKYNDVDKYEIVTSDNIMNIDYPSLNEGFYHNYKYTNKLTTDYCRWKLKYSGDDAPYITNMSWAFSYISTDTGNQYGQFPNIYCDKAIMHLKNGNCDTMQEGYRDNYINSINNNTQNWYTTVSSINEALNDDKIWSDVDNDVVYYNGVLYDLNKYLTSKRNTKFYTTVNDVNNELVNKNTNEMSSYIYDEVSSNLAYTIDKFAVLLIPNNITNENTEYIYSKQSLTQVDKTSSLTSNCKINKDNNPLYISYVNDLYGLYENDMVFVSVNDDEIDKSSINNDDTTMYYTINDDYLKHNTWYEYDDVKDKLSYIDNTTIKNYTKQGFLMLPYDNTNVFYYRDGNSINMNFDSNTGSLYYSEKTNTTKHYLGNNIKNTDIIDNNYFVERTFVSSYILEDINEDIKRYNYVPAFSSDEMMNDDYFIMSPDNKIQLYNQSPSQGYENQVFVDVYNLKSLFEKYNLDFSAYEDSIIDAYCVPISLAHVTEYLNEFYPSFDDKQISDILYIQKTFSYIKKDNIKIIHKYEKAITQDDVDAYYDYVACLNYDEKTKRFLYKNNEISLMIKQQFVPLSKLMYDTLIVENNEPLMLYCVNDTPNDDEIHNRLLALNDECYEYNSYLVPIVNSIYKSDTREDMKNLVSGSKIHEYVYNNEHIMLYTEYNTMFIENYSDKYIRDENNEFIDDGNGDYIHKKLYKKISTVDISFNKNIDEAVVDESNLYIMKHNDKNYMFYLINVDYMCSSHAFNIDNGVFFTHVNGVEYDNSMFDIVAPYLKQSLFNKFAQMATTMLMPMSKIINIKYLPIKYDDGNTINSYKYEYLFDDTKSQTKNVYDIKFVDKTISKVKFNRYFNSITPLITKQSMVDTYELKFKNIDKTINENNIYHDLLNIYEYSPIQYYSEYNTDTHELGETQYFDEYEYKHFNDNHMWNLCKSFTIMHDDKAMSYDKLVSCEDTNTTFEYFKKYLKKHTFYNAIDEITILFLFNKYSVSYISEPIKLSNDKSTKLYTLTYKFILI